MLTLKTNSLLFSPPWVIIKMEEAKEANAKSEEHQKMIMMDVEVVEGNQMPEVDEL